MRSPEARPVLLASYRLHASDVQAFGTLELRDHVVEALVFADRVEDLADVLAPAMVVP
jgi:hypothetical protein